VKSVPVEAVDGLEEVVRRWIAEMPLHILRLEPGDALAIQCHRRITKEQAEMITAQVQGVLGKEIPVLLFPPDFEPSHVVRSASNQEGSPK
jgi:hypothetical protein